MERTLQNRHGPSMFQTCSLWLRPGEPAGQSVGLTTDDGLLLEVVLKHHRTMRSNEDELEFDCTSNVDVKGLTPVAYASHQASH